MPGQRCVMPGQRCGCVICPGAMMQPFEWSRVSAVGRQFLQEKFTMSSMARRMFELVEPIGVIPYWADEPTEAMFALGFTNYWDTYFAGRAAPLGLATAEVVDALFYNFAPGEVGRHIPTVWNTTSCSPSTWACPPRNSDGSTTSRRRSWPP
jgi:hypothetical protein